MVWRVSFSSFSQCPELSMGIIAPQHRAGSQCLLPFRWPGGLPGPRLLPAGHLPEQPPVPGLTGPAGHHPAEPRRRSRCEVLLRSHQAPGGEGQHSHHPWRKSLQQQVAAVTVTPDLGSCTVWENFCQRFYLCFNRRCCFQELHLRRWSHWGHAAAVYDVASVL